MRTAGLHLRWSPELDEPLVAVLLEWFSSNSMSDFFIERPTNFISMLQL